MEKISIIVPIYNKENTLRDCLDSLLNQTLYDIQVICIDDGSTDHSLDILEEYKKNDNRIVFFSQKNSGVASARNKGLQLSNGKYIMFCDPDDTFSKDMCMTMFNFIDKNNYELAICSMNINYYTNIKLKKSDELYYKIPFEGIAEPRFVIKNIDVSLCNKIFKKCIIDKYNIDFPNGYIYEDACFCFKYISVIQKIYLSKNILYNYNRYKNSIMDTTFSKNNSSIDHILVMEDVYKHLNRYNLIDKFGDIFTYLYITDLHFAIHFSKFKNYLKILITAHLFIKKNKMIKCGDLDRDFVIGLLAGKIFNIQLLKLVIKFFCPYGVLKIYHYLKK